MDKPVPLKVFFACDRATLAAKLGRRVYRVGPRKVSVVKRDRLFVGKLARIAPHGQLCAVEVRYDFVRMEYPVGKVSILTRRERSRG